ncbi:MAG: ABC transporter permease [Actinomycetota bacterium]
MIKIGTIAWYNLVRMFRERTNLFFVLVFPLLIIALLGAQFGDPETEGSEPPEIGLTGDGELAARAAEQIDESGAARVRWVDSESELRDLVGDETLPVGVAVPPDAEATLRDGEQPRITLLLGSDEDVSTLRGVATRAFSAEAAVPGVVGQLAATTDAPESEVAQVASQLADDLTPIEVENVVAGGAEANEIDFGFNQVAVGMLLLFVFLNTLTGAAELVQSRSEGVSRRMVATPTSLRTIVVGEGVGRWGIGLFQAAYIMIASAVLFGVEWGDLASAIAVIAVFAAVAAGAAMLIGALMANAEQTAAITVLVGLVLGALGGTMFPLELFGSTMSTVAHVTPHAWGIDALTEMGRHGATLVEVLPQLGVLAAMAVVLAGLAAWRLRLTLTRLR